MSEKTLFTLEIKKIYLNFIKTQTTLVNIKPKKKIDFQKLLTLILSFSTRKFSHFTLQYSYRIFLRRVFANKSSIVATECKTVEWSLPNFLPISKRELSVNILERYIATCLGRTTPRVLFLNKDLVLLFHKTMPLLSELTQQLFGQEQMCS